MRLGPFFFFCPAGASEFGQFLAAHFYFDGPERVTSDVIGIVVERDAFGRDAEILRCANVFREKSLFRQLVVILRFVLFVNILADQLVEPLQLRLR